MDVNQPLSFLFPGVKQFTTALEERLARLRQRWNAQDREFSARGREEQQAVVADGMRHGALYQRLVSRAFELGVSAPVARVVGLNASKRVDRWQNRLKLSAPTSAPTKPSAPIALSKEQQQFVDREIAAARRKRRSDVIVDAFKIELTAGDLLTLGPQQWLNDNVIDMYLQLAVANKDAAAFTTQFFTKLEREGYAGVRRWAQRKKLDVFKPHYVFVPVNIENVHWSLAVIDNSSKTLTFYDSMNSTRGAAKLKTLAEYMKNEARRLKRPESVVNEYTQVPRGNCPQQKNGYDCGVFMCLAVTKLAQNQPLSYCQNEMPVLRKGMALTLLEQRLLMP